MEMRRHEGASDSPRNDIHNCQKQETEPLILACFHFALKFMSCTFDAVLHPVIDEYINSYPYLTHFDSAWLTLAEAY